MEKYIQPFITTCQKVFRDFVGLEIIACTPYFIDTEEKPHWDISGIIGLAGEAQGAIVLSLKKELALKITESLTKQPQDDITNIVFDAVGEIINIIAGNVKKELESMFKLYISLPTIIEGQSHDMACLKSRGAYQICIPFKVQDRHSFSLTITLQQC